MGAKRPDPATGDARSFDTRPCGYQRDITNRTGENPTVSTWDGKVIVRRCPDPNGVVYHEAPDGNQPGVLELQYWCFSAIRPSLVTVDAAGVPDFSNAFGAEYMSTDRHVSHSGGFPIVENQDPDARFNPYTSTIDGVACGIASLDPTPPYMHDGSVPTLHDVLELYNAGGDDDNEIEMRPLGLTPEEIADLEAFLHALHSETFVVPLR